MAADIYHATSRSARSACRPSSHLFFNQMILKYTKYPKAAKEFLRFMMEKEQYEPWSPARRATSRRRCADYDKTPIWTSDPKNTPYRDSVKNMRPAGYAGQAGLRFGGRAADFIVVNMVAEAGQRHEIAERGGGARAEARRALLQGLTRVGSPANGDPMRGRRSALDRRQGDVQRARPPTGRRHARVEASSGAGDVTDVLRASCCVLIPRFNQPFRPICLLSPTACRTAATRSGAVHAAGGGAAASSS